MKSSELKAGDKGKSTSSEGRITDFTRHMSKEKQHKEETREKLESDQGIVNRDLPAGRAAAKERRRNDVHIRETVSPTNPGYRQFRDEYERNIRIAEQQRGGWTPPTDEKKPRSF